eukprot:3481545-Amphidinium_carterae.1
MTRGKAQSHHGHVSASKRDQATAPLGPAQPMRLHAHCAVPEELTEHPTCVCEAHRASNEDRYACCNAAKALAAPKNLHVQAVSNMLASHTVKC